MFAVSLFFFGQKPQQYLVPNLVARRIILDNGYQLTIPHDVFALSEALHCDLQGSSLAEHHIMIRCDPLVTTNIVHPRGLLSHSRGAPPEMIGTFSN